MSFHETFIKSSSLKNMSNIDSNITETVDNLEPIKYFNKILNKSDYGFEISSVQKELPNLITKIDNTTNGIDYTSLIPILVKEIQDIKHQLKEQHQRKPSLADDIKNHTPIFKNSK